MPEVAKTEHPHIVLREGVCGGEPVIDGLRVAVRHVATLHGRGETITEIAASSNSRGISRRERTCALLFLVVPYMSAGSVAGRGGEAG